MFRLAEPALSKVGGATWRGGPIPAFAVSLPDPALMPSCPVAVPPPAY